MTELELQHTLIGREVVFPDGIPGFAGERRFRLADLGADTEPFLELHGEQSGPHFVVVPPGAIWPDYTLELPEDLAAGIGVTDAGEAAILAIVTVHAAPAVPTVNLLGPLVVNVSTGQALQMVLAAEDADPMRPVTAATPF